MRDEACSLQRSQKSACVCYAAYCFSLFSCQGAECLQNRRLPLLHRAPFSRAPPEFNMLFTSCQEAISATGLDIGKPSQEKVDLGEEGYCRGALVRSFSSDARRISASHGVREVLSRVGKVSLRSGSVRVLFLHREPFRSDKNEYTRTARPCQGVLRRVSPLVAIS